MCSASSGLAISYRGLGVPSTGYVPIISRLALATYVIWWPWDGHCWAVHGMWWPLSGLWIAWTWLGLSGLS
jgi:hypothetical protein